MRRTVRRATSIAAVLIASSVAAFTTGCGSSSDPASPPAAQFPGSYSLRTLNGRTLPVVLGQDSTGAVIAIASDAYTFNGDGTFTEQYAFTTTPASGPASTDTYSDSGTWQLSGTALLVSYASDGSTSTGAFSAGNTITFTSSSFTLVYQK